MKRSVLEFGSSFCSIVPLAEVRTPASQPFSPSDSIQESAHLRPKQDTRTCDSSIFVEREIRIRPCAGLAHLPKFESLRYYSMLRRSSGRGCTCTSRRISSEVNRRPSSLYDEPLLILRDPMMSWSAAILV